MAICQTQGGGSKRVGYAVVILVNGIPLTGMNLSRQFNAKDPEAMTLTGHAIVQLDAGDVITVMFVPTIRQKRYQIDQLSARLNVKLEPWF